MNTYVAYVRVTTASGSTAVVKTMVQAENTMEANWLLEGQYGVGNVVHQPQQVG
jgi:hypothetical protein